MADPLAAQVIDVDDPENRGRVKVSYSAAGARRENWAEQLRPDPTVRPPAWGVGETVMILFEDGDPDLPLVLGTLAPYRNPRADLATELPQTDAGWSDLIVPAGTRRQLEQIRTNAPGSAVLLSGPAGTGKTMAAQVVANELGNVLLKVDLARVVSKYIGETEKNLRAVFDRAEASHAVLFFDEADALFGKRSEVKDSHDRYANLEAGYLLQRIEEYSGLVILATNRKQNIDPAFIRRLRAAISFPAPRR